MNNINLYRLGLSGWKGRRPKLITLARAAGEAAAYRQVQAQLDAGVAPNLLATVEPVRVKLIGTLPFKPAAHSWFKRLWVNRGVWWRRRDG